MKRSDMSSVGSVPLDAHNAFKMEFVNTNLSNLLGEVLTVIDASTQGEQNKAMKDLIRRSFSDKQNWFYELSWKLEEEAEEAHGPRQEWERGIVPVDNSRIYSFNG